MRRPRPAATPRPTAMLRPLSTALLLSVGLLTGPLGAFILCAVHSRKLIRRASAPVSCPGDVVPAGSAAADALVVFGATATEAGPSRELAARLDHAQGLWRMGVAPLILVCGGIDGHGVDEAAVMARYLVQRGVPADAVATIRPGGSTRSSLASLRGYGFTSYVGVSSPFHIPRIADEARRQRLLFGVSCPASTPETRNPRVRRVRFVVDVVGVGWYALPPSWIAWVDTGPGTLRHVLPHVLAGVKPARALLSLRHRGPSPPEAP